MRGPGESSEMGFEPINPSPQPDEFIGQSGVGELGGIPGEDGIDRRVEASRIVKINRSIVEYSDHSKDLPSRHKMVCRRPSAKPSNAPHQTGGSV